MPAVHPADPLGVAAVLRGGVVWEELCAALDELTGGEPLRVVDAGGGSGGLAVPLAERGYDVLVVDPSPDSLASLERRARERGVAERVRGRQGDLSSLLDVVAAGEADVLLCHDVLEMVDDPADGLQAARQALRPGGLLSVLAANRSAAVVARVLAGRFDAAEQILTGPSGCSAGERLQRRFDADQLADLVGEAGFAVRSVHGDAVFTDLVPRAALDPDPAQRTVLARLEERAARAPAFSALATRLHLLAERS